jgi:hypothetical protein
MRALLYLRFILKPNVIFNDMSGDIQKCIRGLLAVIALVGFTSLSAQVTNTQSFDAVTFLPTGWTGIGTTNYWSRKTTGTFPTITPHSGAGMARFDSHAAAAGTAQTIVTPVIDYSNIGGNTATFSLWLYRDTTSAKATIGDSLSVFINTTASLTGATELGVIARSATISLPNTVASAGWYQYSFNIPAGFNTNTNYILLEGTSQLGDNIFIDDVVWVSYPALCTGTPAAGTMSVNNPLICGGTGSTSITLSGETTGFAGLSYVWESASSLSGPWTVIDTAVTAINTGTITATTYYKCVVGCSFSATADSITDSVVVTTNPVPVITITPNTGVTYCSGAAPVSLVASGAQLFTWTPTTGLNTNISDSVLASPTATTRYTVTGIDSLGCYGSATVNVTTRRSPAAGITASANAICPGDTVVLVDTLTAFGNVTFAWSSSQTTDSISVAPLSSTNYYATVTAGGCSTTDTVAITVTANPIAAFTYSANDTTITFTNTSLGATSYFWNLGNGDTSILQNPVSSYPGVGSYAVTLIAYGVCNNDTVTDTVSIYPSGILSVAAIKGLTVWPVPANNVATVEFISEQSNATLSLMNELGQVMETRIAAPKSGEQYKEEFNLGGLTSGVYMVRIHTGSKDATVKLIKL